MGDVPARILIVDDDARSRAVACSLLRGASNSFEFASSGAEALEIARQWQPDLLLLDVMMPEEDGFEICRRLRADPGTAELRVFMLTALDDSASRLAAFEAGADDFITKPVPRVETLARIQAIARLNRYRALVRRRREMGSVLPPREGPPPTPLTIERTLDEALEKLTLWFQPIVTPTEAGMRVLAHEALVRTAGATLAQPAELFAAARALGQLEALSLAVRKRLAAKAEAHPEATFFFNVNVEELADDSLLAATDVLAPCASRIVVEITEREPVDSIRDYHHRIRTLRRRGFRIAVDDLGAGYSSLESLVVVEPDFVKLDRSIVSGIDHDSRRRAIVQSIARLARELGIETIAEGVETEAEARVLAALGCPHLQGYHFGRPSPDLVPGEPA
jgi:EAL domain-containing protein (putative c-di-GMP-specific phosphodiesterase class I)